MKYTAEQLKPKKYPDEKPSEDRAYVNYRVLLDNGTQSLFNWNPISQSDGKMIWNKYVTWFIDIPNPPSELKFLAYPQNKPEQDGEYCVHDCNLDVWCRAIWDGDILSVWTANVDYFVNYRLDKENEMTGYNFIDLFMVQDDKTGKIEIQQQQDDGGILELVTTRSSFLPLCKKYLETQGYDVVKRVGQPSFKDKVLWHDKHIEITDLDGLTDIFMIASISSPKRYVFVTDEQLAECHKAVEEREPEWLPCPNPECRCKRAVYIDVNTIDSLEGDYTYYSVLCDGCGYCGPEAKTPQEAIRLHNMIADNAKRSSLCEPENEYYGLWCDEDGNVLPRKEK